MDFIFHNELTKILSLIICKPDAPVIGIIATYNLWHKTILLDAGMPWACPMMLLASV